ncbi:MAG: amidohydrolase family protein [Candidatus Kapabacteria bacterium]|nr:amidohydrolase family protein [Ignavibacteriota bacterium]MCW5886106.1 amidohydrolase family protein [Candidatus Kapabacteria bacterium]
MILKSHFLQPEKDKSVSFLENYYLETDDKGKIIYFGRDNDVVNSYQMKGFVDMTDKIIIPGMIDLHTHIPQYPALGLGKGTLLEWLEDYIFPLETKFDNQEYAFYLSRVFFEDSIKYGTTTLVAYSSSSFSGTNSAFKAAKESGIRAYIGMSLMDLNAPSALQKTINDNLIDTEKLINKWHNSSSGMLKYIVTPRYALSCSHELMSKAAIIAKTHDLYIQTHLAENKEEIRRIYQAYPEHNTYTDVYDSAGILGDKTILAHCIYLSDYEVDLIKDRNASIVHCASSNRYLKSGVFPFKKLSKLIKTGIGTDVAGGISISLINEIKAAVETSKTYQIMGGDESDGLCPQEALWTVTRGNAEILGIDNETGSFDLGNFADFITFDTDRFRILNENIKSETVINKLVYILGNNIPDDVYINGKLMYSSGK